MIAASASILVLSVLTDDVQHRNVADITVFLLVTAAADAMVLHLHHGRSKEFISLLESAICMNILLFPSSLALGITIAGSLISNLLHRRHPIKIFFNLSQYGVGTAAAVLLFRLVSSDQNLGWRMILGLVLGMAAFGIVNSTAVAGLVAILERRSFRRILSEGRLISMLTVLGNTALGILAAVMWMSEPGLTILFVAPAAILQLAYRGVVKTNELLETVRSERDRLNRIIVGASDGIALIDAEGKVDVWSPAMARLTGISEDEARGADLSSVLVGAAVDGDATNLVPVLDEPSQQEPTRTVQMVISQRDGGRRVVRVRHTILFDADGDCVGDAMIVHDITREHESEQLKDDFLARVSHELRTPLTPIKGYAQTLLRRGDAVPKDLHDEALTSIVERVDHMQGLIEDLLLVSRIVAGRASLADQIRPQAVDLVEVCRSAVASFAVTEPNRQIGLDLDEPIPTITADPARIEQIITNLLSNACKYSEDGLPVKVVLRHEGDRVAVDIADRGRGIATEHLDKVFERFFRTEDPLTMSTGGAGLGLHISQELARAMGGDLAVRSTLGRGSTFTVHLPIEPASLRTRLHL